MKILILSQYFYPEVGATQNRIYEFAKYLASQGHKTTIITEFPNHPTGIIPKEYKYRLIEKEFIDRFNIIRVWVFTTKRKNAITRIFFYISYMIMSVIAGMFLCKRYDIVFATSPPLFVGISGCALSKIKKAHFILDIRDLWPESAVVLGELSNQKLIKFIEKIERFLYKKAEAIVAVTKGILNYIYNLGVTDHKLFFIPNGTIPEIFDPKYNDPSLKSKIGLDNKFIVCFAGNHGLAQGLETVIESAKLLQNDPDITFLFIGEGPAKNRLIEMKNENKLSNVLFLPKISLNKIAYYINMSDVMLVTLKKADIFLGALPSKMFDYMCCAKPIIITIDGEAHELIEKAKAGIFVEPGNAEELANAILKLKNNRYICQEYGKNGRNFVLNGYVRAQQAVKLENLMKSLLKKGKTNKSNSGYDR